jgi:uncharacterized protein
MRRRFHAALERSAVPTETNETDGRPDEQTGVPLETRFPGKYLSLTSFKRDGTGVATPVWFVIDGGRLLVKTDPESFKVKRIRHNPVVRIAPCTASGRLRGQPINAHAEVLPNAELGRVDRLMSRKYRIDRFTTLPIYRAVQRLRRAPVSKAEVALAITHTEHSQPPMRQGS